MAIIKKAISVVLLTTFCLALFSASVLVSAETGTGSNTAGNAALADVDINTMAAALNKLNILKGSNGNYMLDNQVDRAQAAALITRMLGKENFVMQNADQLKYTKYADVAADKWYAPYVGYCTLENIMVGISEGSFAPAQYVTEKAFLKMALCTLGYEYGVDFDWSNVYQKAYATGIVSDSSYETKTQDNTYYLRAEAVKVIYRTLNTPKKGTSSRLINVLVEEGAFTREMVAASGIFGSDKATAIVKITATAPNSIEISLNEAIQNVNPGDINIYDSSGADKALAVKSVAFKDDKIQVITAGQVPDRTYIVTIKSITDAIGNVSGDIAGTFKGYVQQQIISDFFRIQKVEQVSANVINVYFTHPVNTSSETPAYYELIKDGTLFLAGSAQNFTVKKLQSADNAVSIYLKNTTLSPGEVYTVRISGKLTSSYGVRLGDGYGESMDLVAAAIDEGQLTVSSVMAWSSNSVRIVFSRDIDAGWAEKKLNYTVYDKAYKNPIEVTNAVVGGTGSTSGKEVLLSLSSTLDTKKQYEVKIDYIPDIYKQSAIENKSFAFSGEYPVNTELALSQAVSDYSNCVVLIFNRALDKSSAEKVSNYTIRGINDGSFNIAPIKAYYSEKYGLYAVKLFLPAGYTFSSSQKYRVYVSGLRDSLGTNKSTFFQAEFTGGGNSVVRPRIADAVTVSKDAVKLLFDVEIAFSLENLNTSNFSLEYVENGETLKMNPIGVTYVDPLTLVLRFEELNPGTAYQLRFNSITDYSGIYTRTAEEGGNTIAVRWGK